MCFVYPEAMRLKSFVVFVFMAYWEYWCHEMNWYSCLQISKIFQNRFSYFSWFLWKKVWATFIIFTGYYFMKRNSKPAMIYWCFCLSVCYLYKVSLVTQPVMDVIISFLIISTTLPIAAQNYCNYLFNNIYDLWVMLLLLLLTTWHLFSGTSQIRLAHTDIKVPDFSAYRRDSTKPSTAKSSETADARRAFTYMMLAGNRFWTGLMDLHVAQYALVLSMKKLLLCHSSVSFWGLPSLKWMNRYAAPITLIWCFIATHC